MERVYICSPYKAESDYERTRNIEYAKILTSRILRNKKVPITPHLYITQCVDDDIPEERSMGLVAALELLKLCDWVYVGAAYGISEGMKSEIELARSRGINVFYTHYMVE